MNPRSPIKIVLIDDEPVILTVLSGALKQIGFAVETYGSAVEFMSAHGCKNCSCRCCPDVILTDINMPKVDGIEFLNLLHQQKCKCSHIALMTGYGLSDVNLHKIKKDGIRLFTKPFSLANFTAWIELIK